MSFVTNITFHCDRCRKEIIPDTGTINENRFSGLQLIGSHEVNASGKIENLPDLCDECLSSLENWFSSDEYKKVESNWEIETDLPKMDQAISLMAVEIRRLRDCGDSINIIDYYLNLAGKMLEDDNEKT